MLFMYFQSEVVHITDFLYKKKKKALHQTSSAQKVLVCTCLYLITGLGFPKGWMTLTDLYRIALHNYVLCVCMHVCLCVCVCF